MTLYAIFDPQPGKPHLPSAIAERFSWAAALLPPVYMAVHGLWLPLVTWLAGFAALVLATPLVGPDATMALYLLGALFLGFSAPDLRRRQLVRSGWTFRSERFSASAEQAQLEAMQ